MRERSGPKRVGMSANFTPPAKLLNLEAADVITVYSVTSRRKASPTVAVTEVSSRQFALTVTRTARKFLCKIHDSRSRLSISGPAHLFQPHMH